MPPEDASSRIRAQVGDAAWAVKVLREAGVVRPLRPDKALRLGERFVRLGTSPALASAGAAITEPDELAIIDEIGALSFGATHERSNALAWACGSAGWASGTALRSCAATTATSSRRRWPAPSSGPSRST
jgi:hypothetical protein